MDWVKINYQYGNALIDIDAIDAISINEHACVERYCKNDYDQDCDECKYSGYMVNVLVSGKVIPIKTFHSIEDAENLRDSILQQIEGFLAQPIKYELKV